VPRGTLRQALRNWPPWKPWIRRRPNEAVFVLGGFLGLLFFAVMPAMGGAYDIPHLVVSLLTGVLIMWIRIWRLRRRDW